MVPSHSAEAKEKRMDDTGTATANARQPNLPGSGAGGVRALSGLAVLLLLIGGILIFLWPSDPVTPTAAAAPEPTLEWPAKVLLFSYKQNELKADQDFKGRRMLITGKVGKIGKDILGQPYVMLDEESDGIRAVQAFFSESDSRQLAELHRGQTIKVIGTCDGLMMNVLIKNSMIKSVGP